MSVLPGAATTLGVSGFPSTINAGQPGAVTVRAVDAYGNIARGYVGTVHFSSSDSHPAAQVPIDYSFSAADAGQHTFTGGVVLGTMASAGASISATDLASPSIHGTQSGITVLAGSIVRFGLSNLGPTLQAGQASSVRITARDAYDNVAVGYSGTVHLSGTYGSAGLPADTAFPLSAAGVLDVAGVQLTRSGDQTVTVTDSTVAAWNGSLTVTVTPQATHHLLLAGIPATVAAGQSATLTVTAQDVYNNTTTAYAGTVHLTSSDPAAILPADAAFTAANGGTRTLTVVLKTAGTRSVTATDTQTSSITGARSGISVSASGAANLVVSGIASGAAGQAGSVTVHAVDGTGNTVSSYVGTVHFTSTDPNGVLPGDYTFVAGDNGTHTFARGITLKTAGTHTVTATDTATAVTGSQSGIAIGAGPVVGLLLSGLTTATAGSTTAVTVTAADAYGNKVTGYTGTVHLTSTDPQAVLPANYTFVGADAGAHALVVTLKTAGTASVTAQDTISAGVAGTHSGIVVSPAAATSLRVAGMPSGVAPDSGTVTVTAQDAYGNTATGYRGTVHLTSSDSQAVTPANYAFAASDNGVHGFAVTLTSAGSQSVTATDTANASITGVQAGIAVSAAGASRLVVSGNTTQTAGSATSVTVTALDPYGNTATGYRGTIAFTSADPNATLPAAYALTAGDAGAHTFAGGVTFKVAGTRSLTATDQVTSSITGMLSGISVAAATAQTLTLSGLTSATAGSTQTLGVTACDAYGNVATSYRGTARVTSSDPSASLPANYTFTASDAGVHTFLNAVALKTVGTRSVTATDTVTSSITGSTSGLVVTPAAAATLTVTGVPLAVMSGVAQSATVTAYDTYGNVATGYRGTVQFSSTDASATLPANTAFTAGNAGVRAFASGVTFATQGTQSVTARDTVNASLQGSETGIVVSGVTAVALSQGGGATGACVARSDGTIKCWGNNDNGSLGYGDARTRGDRANEMGINLPTVSLGAGRSALQVVVNGLRPYNSADADHTCVVLDNHKVMCWGNNNVGQLGVGDQTDRNTPTAVDLGTGRTALSISNGYKVTCALLDTHQMTCWGSNDSGELGMGDTRSRSAPGAIVNLGFGRSALATANSFLGTCALLDTHQIKCWGWNGSSGILGYGDANERHSPANATVFLGSGRSAQAVVMGEGNNYGEACALLDTGAVKCWGDNTYGELGYGDTDTRQAPPNAVINLRTGRTATAVSVGYTHMCALLDNGAVSCWGRNNSGQVGSGDSGSHYTPTLVSLGTGRTAVAVRAAGNYSCAILDNGDVKCWGNNKSGELGLGDTQDRGDTTATVPSKNVAISF